MPWLVWDMDLRTSHEGGEGVIEHGAPTGLLCPKCGQVSPAV